MPSGTEFQIDSLDTGWSSGRLKLTNDVVVELLLSKPGENTFKIFVFDSSGASVTLNEEKISISRTAASIDAIPASHSIGIEVQEKAGGQPTLDYLVREGDQLPTKGKRTFRAAESLQSGSPHSIKFKLWEGDIANPITDNRFIGMLEIKGTDFDDGVIAAGAELVCEYEALDSGAIRLEVEVPSIGASFDSGRNFYSSQDGKIDYSNQAKRISEQSSDTLNRINETSSIIDDKKLEQARKKLERSSSANANNADPEIAKQAMDDVQEAKKLLAQARSAHKKEIRQLDLDKVKRFFDSMVRSISRETEISSFDNPGSNSPKIN